MKNKIDVSKLAQIINDTWDAVERSKVGSIYLLDTDGNTKRDIYGVPICCLAGLQVFQTILSQVIPKEMEIDHS